MKATQVLVLLSLAAGLCACGGGSADDVPSPASNDVPASATVSPTAYSQFVGSLVKTDTGQPLEVNQVIPPTSETAQPLPVT
jgi:hypothetical protein